MKCPKCKKGELLMFVKADITFGTGEIYTFHKCYNCAFSIFAKDIKKKQYGVRDRTGE